MNIESKLWKIVIVGCQIAVLQKASGTQRYVSIGKFPNSEALAAMSEREFNRICREAFHGEREYQR